MYLTLTELICVRRSLRLRLVDNPSRAWDNDEIVSVIQTCVCCCDGEQASGSRALCSWIVTV